MSKRYIIIAYIILVLGTTSLSLLFRESCCTISMYGFPSTVITTTIDGPEIEFNSLHLVYNFVFFSGISAGILGICLGVQKYRKSVFRKN